jgi:hypothetical protein
MPRVGRSHKYCAVDVRLCNLGGEFCASGNKQEMGEHIQMTAWGFSARDVVSRNRRSFILVSGEKV